MKYIKNLFLITMLSLSFFVISCEDDDNNTVVIPNIDVAIQSPADDTQSVGFNPTFTWAASGDNVDAFKYDFYIGTEENKLGLRAENITALEYRITNNTVLKGNKYYWKVVAKDGIYEKESDVWSFTTSPALSEPVLIGPIGFGRDPLNFEWEPLPAATDEALTYKIYLGQDNPPTELVGTVEGTGTFTYDGPELTEFDTYYWRVEVSDMLNASMSEVGTFQKLLGGYPDLPTIVAPLNNTLLFQRDGDVILDWTDSTDPEGDTVTYDVYLDTANPPVNIVASFSGDSEYNVTSNLVENTSYYWHVVAKDASGNSYSTETFNFDYVGSSGPATPTLSEEVVDGTMSLDESIVWGKVVGAATLDVYIDEMNPPTTKVASDVTGEGYIVRPRDIPSDITVATKTYYARVVAKNVDGEAESSVISFTPQLTGVYTDVRGSESLDYNWVRLGSQVWMSDNLRTKKLTNGDDLTKVVQPTSGDYPITGSTTELFYDEHPVDNGPIAGHPTFTSPWSDGSNGRAYSSRVRREPLIAPEGWHVINDSDISTLRSNFPNASDLLDEWYGGSDAYGANFVIAGYRYNDFNAGRPFGFRYGVEEGRVAFWINGSGSNNAFELYPNGNYRTFNQGNEHNRMFGIRLVKD
ncbi:FISUMP domain-containing protein [Flavivirga algicola]|uniref:Fibronectin type-III domain-containing protein n=1 Tax=Flavivirga algicola TaxID=2729136 RepID=A0ABX1S1Y0_9FLAO|nr:FISUMP domain-containing protein [Flavivirga algicola]NMH89852.1 hypothetical protein [Flavivirga algicola]